MKTTSPETIRRGALGLAFALGATAIPALAVTVQVNGETVNLNPPPVERAGRVLVPLRGVFERLGASVVYANGTINATKGRQTVSLQIGSTQATIDGQPQTIDVAPFIIGASTYVPLRFVSQALGATVNYNNSSDLVSIVTGGPPIGGPPPGPPEAAGQILRDRAPAEGEVVNARRPAISANFNVGVEPNSVRVFLDGVNVTPEATRSRSGFVYTPASPLQPMTHVVRVTGREDNGAVFDRTWRFTTTGE